MKALVVTVCLVLTVSRAFAADTVTGTVCVAPVPATPDPRSGILPVCASGNFSFKIDNLEAVAFSHKESLKVEGLDQGLRHRVKILCDGKPHQTFWFHSSDFHSTPCLFINDLYKTAQLWEVKRCPWCKCK